MKEIVVISGKGGTGKTSLTASFAVLAEHPVIADCDVDAPDLHLVLSPRVMDRHEFRSGHQAIIRESDCAGCGLCKDQCRFDAILRMERADGLRFRVNPIACEGCGVCVRFCPCEAIDFPERISGEWMVSQTRCGPMVHAQLAAGAESSGRLVATVRREAQRIAKDTGSPCVLVDGPPGIGCPVIASVTGASVVLAVTEPTVAGEHDLKRVLALTRHFGIPTAVCVNKWDLDPEMADQIEKSALRNGARLTGRIRYDPGVPRAQLAGRSVMETETPATNDIREIWRHLDP